MFNFLKKSTKRNKIKNSMLTNDYIPHRENHIFYEEYNLRPNSYEDFLDFYKDDIL